MDCFWDLLGLFFFPWSIVNLLEFCLMSGKTVHDCMVLAPGKTCTARGRHQRLHFQVMGSLVETRWDAFGLFYGSATLFEKDVWKNRVLPVLTAYLQRSFLSLMRAGLNSKERRPCDCRISSILVKKIQGWSTSSEVVGIIFLYLQFSTCHVKLVHIFIIFHPYCIRSLCPGIFHERPNRRPLQQPSMRCRRCRRSWSFTVTRRRWWVCSDSVGWDSEVDTAPNSLV